LSAPRAGYHEAVHPPIGGAVIADERTRPNAETRAAERDDAQTTAHADRAPTPEEERRAEELEPDADVAKHEKEMAERGADQQGEGRIG
jgi:hypothetical protein